jgi:hypothetical protein
MEPENAIPEIGWREKESVLLAMRTCPFSMETLTLNHVNIPF